MMELILIRTAERLIAVIIGGLAIYLGFLLFNAVKTPSEGDVKVKLTQDMTVMLSRIGPGVFFALFGAAIVSASFFFPIEYSKQQENDSETVQIRGIGDQGGNRPVQPDSQDTELERIRLRGHIEFLNQLSSHLSDSGISDQQRQRAERQALALKLLLMREAWDDGWGRFEDFKLWAEAGAEVNDPAVSTNARDFFRSGK